MGFIDKYTSHTPSAQDHIIGTDKETGETKNFFFDKIAEYVVGFFQANQQTDFSTPTLYPDMASVMNGANVNLDLVDKKGVWYFNKVLEYKNASLKFDQYINTITVEVNVFTDPNDASKTYIKQNVHNHKTNKSYERMELSTQLLTTSFVQLIPLSNIESGTSLVKAQKLMDVTYRWMNTDNITDNVIRTNGDVNLDVEILLTRKYTFDEVGDITINGDNLNTIFTSNYQKEYIGVEYSLFEGRKANGSTIIVFKQVITNFKDGKSFVRTKENNVWSPLIPIS